MGWGGFNLGVPAMFITMLTIGLGGLFVLIGWIIVLTDKGANTHWRNRTALYSLTASVGLELMGTIVLSQIPYDIQDHEILGTRLVTFVWSCFLIASFVFVTTSMLLARKDIGPVKRTVQNGSS